jgi:hypothetical protein
MIGGNGSVEPIEITVRLRPLRSALGMWLFPSTAAVGALMAAAGGLVGAGVGGAGSSPRSVVVGVLVGAAMLPALLAAVTWVGLRSSARAMAAPGSWRLTPDGIEVQTPASSTVVAWVNVIGLRLTARSTSLVTSRPWLVLRTDAPLPPPERSVVKDWWQAARAMRDGGPLAGSAPPAGETEMPVKQPTPSEPEDERPRFQLSVVLTVDELGEVGAEISKHQVKLFKVAVLAIAAVVTFSQALLNDPTPVSLVSAGLVVVVLAGVLLMRPSRLAKRFAGHLARRVGGPGATTWIIDENGIEQLGTVGCVHLSWSRLASIDLDDRVLCARFEPGQSTLMIPRRAFDEGQLACTLAWADAGRPGAEP